MNVNVAIKMDDLQQLTAELTPDQMQTVAGAVDYEVLIEEWQECGPSQASPDITCCYEYQRWLVCHDDTFFACTPEVTMTPGGPYCEYR